MGNVNFYIFTMLLEMWTITGIWKLLNVRPSA